MNGLFLTDNPLPMKKYIFIMAPISLIPSILLSIILTMTGLFDQIGPDIESYDPRIPSLFIVLGSMVIAPVIETLLMSFVFFVLSFFVKSNLRLVVLSAILWACLHSFKSLGWGLVVWWPFFVFSCAYLTWRSKSWLKAIWVTTCIHALQNFIPSVAMLIYLKH